MSAGSLITAYFLLIYSKYISVLFLRYFTKHVNLTDKPHIKWGKVASSEGKNKEEMLLRHQEEKTHTKIS